ncbi:TolC family protein [Taibaiella soli]|uniref:TolC family protein n=1 Tax=Taibaiella soli TaxID=1649169 RepID=A0A2W2B735_9BACT|nr:TolC family protein [Taibaiella soli]PZF71827.1 TolC family protein [Taibaiella soli]
MRSGITTRRLFFLLFLLTTLAQTNSNGQALSLKDAIQTALDNYGTVRAKANYAKASKASVSQAQRDYLPNLNVSAQQDYGTVNGQTGPQYALALGTSSSGPALADQNWNAAFGALYLANLNWDFFAFGRAKDKVRAAQAVAYRDENDYQQERFQQEVRVASAYLNLLAAQRITISWQKNLQRADTFRSVVITRTKNGLIAGVDSSMANAEVSNARIALTKAVDFEQEQANKLAQLMGVTPTDFALDSVFVSRVPSTLAVPATANVEEHPLLQYYKSKVALSKEQTKYIRSLQYPAFTLFSSYQTRGSGFNYNYGGGDLNAYSGAYGDGVNPTRSNYLFGVGLTWNLTSTLRVSKQVKSQSFITKGLQDEYTLADQQIRAQQILADTKIKNALDNYKEAPIQVKAASDAYLQKTVMYRNGLSNIVDVTQALYALNRAETDRDIIYNNVWQALLLKAAASGDFGIFINEF